MSQNLKIPKIIHYCWFGRGKLPPLAQKCIASWKKYLPDYEIKEWNEDSFDVNQIPYTREAYAEKKYAFVSDYARFKILHDYGGLYFDTDVEVIRPMDDIIARGAFMGLEEDISSDLSANPGLGLGCAPGLLFYKKVINHYSTLRFKKANGENNTTTVVQIVSKLFLEQGLKPHRGIMECEGISIYPADYFCPKSMRTGIITITLNTYSIHHFTASWHSPREKLILAVSRILGVWPARLIGLLLRNPLTVPKRVYTFMRYRK